VTTLSVPELIIFDWEGTLLDINAHIISSVRTAVSKVQVEFPGDDAIREVMGLSLPAAIQHLFPAIGATKQAELFREFRNAYIALNETSAPLYPNVEVVLKSLSEQKIKLAIATGKGRIGLEHDLTQSKVRSYFVATRCAEETFSKPHPAMVLELLDELHTEPGNTLVVGDSSNDILMAKNANVKSIAAAYGTNSKEELARYEPDAIILSINEITTLFKMEFDKR